MYNVKGKFRGIFGRIWENSRSAHVGMTYVASAGSVGHARLGERVTSPAPHETIVLPAMEMAGGLEEKAGTRESRAGQWVQAMREDEIHESRGAAAGEVGTEKHDVSCRVEGDQPLAIASSAVLEARVQSCKMSKA